MKKIKCVMLGICLAAVISLASCANANKTGGAEAAAASDSIPPVSQDIPGDTINKTGDTPVEP